MSPDATLTAVPPFVAKDCALITLSLGVRAANLKEFRDALTLVPAASIYHHFWERLLRPAFDEPEYNNDFASWVYHALHEKGLAERLALIDPTDATDLEGLRHEVVEVVDTRLDELEVVPWARADQHFYFLRSHLVIFDTGDRFASPEALAAGLPHFSTGGIFYHFIDARRRTPGRTDDFSAWLADHDPPPEGLLARLAELDPYFSSLENLRRSLVAVLQGCLPTGGDPDEASPGLP